MAHGRSGPSQPRSEVNNQQCESWLVKAAENITVAPKCQQIVMGWLELEEQKLPPLVLVEPAQVPIEGILPARGLSRVGSSVQTPRSMTSQDDHTAVHVMVANFSKQELTISKAIALGIAEEVAESVVDKINAGSDDDACKSKTLRKQKRNEMLYDKLLKVKLGHLTQRERQQIEPVLMKYVHVFHDEESNE